MNFLAFVLAVAATLTSAGTLLLSLMLIFADGLQSPVFIWGYTLLFVAFLMILLGILSALLIWVRPFAAEKTLWLLVIDSLLAVVLVAIAMSVAQPAEGIKGSTVLGNIVLGGLTPGMLALASALMLRRHLQTLPPEPAA
jgi:hypothetical protein